MTAPTPDIKAERHAETVLVDAFRWIASRRIRDQQLSLDLRPGILDDPSLMSPLNRHFKHSREQTGAAVDFRHINIGTRVESNLETTQKPAPTPTIEARRAAENSLAPTPS